MFTLETSTTLDSCDGNSATQTFTRHIHNLTQLAHALSVNVKALTLQGCTKARSLQHRSV